MSTFVDNERFFVEHCCNCGMAFAMTDAFHERKLKDQTYFSCPSGHQQHYTGLTEEQKLRKEVERKQQMLDAANARADTSEREREQIAKAHKKMRERVMNGVCPCCNRTFQNLMMHMRSEHPEFREFKTLSTLRAAFGMPQAAVANEAGVITAYVSLYEREKPVPSYAKSRLDGWVAKHNKVTP